MRRNDDPPDVDPDDVLTAAAALWATYAGYRQHPPGSDAEEEHASHGCVVIHDDPRGVALLVLEAVRGSE